MNSTITVKTYLNIHFHNFFGRAYLWVVFIFFMGFAGTVVGQNLTTPTYIWESEVELPTVNVTFSGVNTDDITIAVATDPEGNIYTLSFGKGVSKRSATGTLINASFIPASRLDSPLDIAIDENGFIYIADYFAGGETSNDNGKIWVFSPEGALIISQTIYTSFFRPLGVDVDEENVYVAEFNDGNSGPESNQLSRIRIYNKTSGVPVLSTADVNTPFRIAVDSQKNIYVSQAGNNSPSVRIYNQDLIFQSTLPNILSPGSIVIDPFDFIHVIEYDGRIDFSQFINFEELGIPQVQSIAKKIDDGQKANAFSIKIFDPNRLLKITLKDKIDFPVDLIFNNCDKMFVNNAKIFGSNVFIIGYVPDRLEFDLEIYKRTPSFDTQKPLFSCPADITVTATVGATSAIVNYTVPIPTDNCSTPVLTRDGPAPGSSFPLGPTVITYTAEDAAGNVETCFFTIIVNTSDDETPPIPVVRNDDFYEVNAYENLIADNNPIDGILENDTYTSGFQIEIIDEVGFGVLNLNRIDGTFIYTPNDRISRTGGTDRFTYRLIDADGIVSETSAIVTIQVIQLTIDCPDNIQLQVDLNGECEVPLPDFTALVSANNPNAVINQSPLPDTPISENTLITFTATVNDRGSVFCERTVEVINRATLEFNCSSTPIEVIADAGGNFEMPDYTGLVDVTSSCGIENITQNPPPGTIINSSQTIVFTISDDFEVEECEIELTLNQPDPPFSINCVSNYLVELEDKIIEIPTSEFVEGDLSNIEFTIAKQSFTCTDIGISTITIEAKNLNTGEIASCNVEVEVIDVGKPFIVCFAEDQPRSFVEGGSYTLENLFENRINDNCTPIEQLVVLQNPPPGTVWAEAGTYPVTVTVTDNNDNIETCTVNIVLEGVTAAQPAFSCNNNPLEVNVNSNCSYIVEDYTDRVSNFQNFTSASVIQNIDTGTSITADTLIILSVYDNGELVDTCEFWLILQSDDLPEIVQCSPDITRNLTNGEFVLGDYRSEMVISASCETTTRQQFPAPGISITETTEVEIKLLDSNDIVIDTCTFTITIQDETDPDAPAFDCLSDDLELIPNASCEYIVDNYTTSVTNFQNFTAASVVQNIAPGTKILEDTYIILDVLDDGVIIGTCEFWLNIDAKDVSEIIQCAPGITRTLTDGGFVLGDYTSEVEISSSCEGTTLQQIPAPGTIITSTTQVEIKLLDSNNIEIDTCFFTITIQPKTDPIPANPLEYIFIYPNPTPGPFTFDTPTGWIIEKVDVFDDRGRYITTVEFPMGEPYNMDLSTLQTAVYTLHLATNQGNKIIRVIIQ